MSIENLRLADIVDCKLVNPKLRSSVERELVDSYEGFISVLYKELDDVIQTLQANPELRQNDQEDRLTIDIVNLLNQAGYDASHETKSGGHVDITVKFRGMFWFGEAKIHSTYDHLLEGFKQLCTRYTRGDINQDHGGVLLYIKQKNAKSVMDRWKEHLSEQNYPDYESSPCATRPLSFFSKHTHDVSGLPFNVRHMPVMLYFNPQDKSAMRRKGK